MTRPKANAYADELAERIALETNHPGERRAIAAALGEGDVIAEYLAVGDVRAVVRAAWVEVCALLAMSRGAPEGAALRAAATALLLDAAEVMEPIVTFPAPPDARAIDG